MRTHPRPTGRWALAVVCLSLLTGCGLSAGEPITISQPSPLPTATPAPIRVHMAGAVVEPGVYELPQDSRVIDGIHAAGGLHADADSDSINLADRCQDGARIYIPYRGTPTPPVPTPVSGSSIATSGAHGVVNINTASASELETLPEIGPVLAERIIAHREAHGPFDVPSDILQVPGIGDATFANIKDRIVTN